MSIEFMPFQARRNQLRQKVAQGWVLLYKGGEYFNENLFYLTGLDSFFTLALISLETEQEYVLTNDIELRDAKAVTDILNVQACRSQELIKKLTSFVALHNISILYCDYGLNSRTPLPAQVIDSLRASFPGLVIEDLPQELLRMRMIKEPGEIELIKENIAIVEKILASLPEFIRPGLGEAEFASLIYKKLVQHGFTRFYDIFVASGHNSAKPYYRANNGTLPPDHVVLVDICAARGNYVCDLTRTFPTSGTFPSRWQEIYSLVCSAQQHAKNLIESGRTLHELSENVKRLFKASGLDKFYLNKLGHFVGLAPDDPGDQNITLQKGMVVTIEPGLYLQEAGLRIEDTIAVGNLPESGAGND